MNFGLLLLTTIYFTVEANDMLLYSHCACALVHIRIYWQTTLYWALKLSGKIISQTFKICQFWLHRTGPKKELDAEIGQVAALLHLGEESNMLQLLTEVKFLLLSLTFRSSIGKESTGLTVKRVIKIFFQNFHKLHIIMICLIDKKKQHDKLSGI